MRREMERVAASVRAGRQVVSASHFSALDWVQAAIALLVVAWLNLGIASAPVNQVPGYVRWGAFAAWLGLALVRDRVFMRLFVRHTWPLFVLQVYMALAVRWGSPDLSAYRYGLAYLIVVFTLFAYYSRDRYRPILIGLVTYLAVDLVVVGVNTYVALDADPMVSRYLATSADTRLTYLGDGAFYAVGGYGYAYSLGAIAVFLGYVIFSRAQRRLVRTVLLVGCLVLLVKASFAIAIILTLVLLLAMPAGRAARKVGWRWAIGAAIVGISVLVTIGPAVLERVSRWTILPSMISVRVAEIGQALRGEDLVGTDLHLRFSLYGQSLTAFLHNIPVGTSGNPGSPFSAGGHATWFDLLAVFGLMALLMAVFLIQAFRLTVLHLGDGSRVLVAYVWAYFLLLGTVNTILFSNLLLTWFLIIPFAAKAIRPVGVPRASSAAAVREREGETP